MPAGCLSPCFPKVPLQVLMIFIESVVTAACQLARHGVQHPGGEDVQVHLGMRSFPHWNHTLLFAPSGTFLQDQTLRALDLLIFIQ